MVIGTVGFVAVLAAVAGSAMTALYLRRRWVLVRVDGLSMTPAIEPGATVLVHRLRANRIRVGDVVVVERPSGNAWHRRALGSGTRTPHPRASGGGRPRRWLIKRVAATPGDRVPHGSVPNSVGHDTAVPHAMYVLLGDNRADSTDSRVIGYFPADRILGVARLPRRGSGSGANGERL